MEELIKYESSVNQFKLLFDISSNETPQYEDVINLKIGYEQGEKMDTWQDLYHFLSNNVKTGLDPTWSISHKFDKTDPVCQFILSKEYAVGSQATAKARIVNLLKGTNGKQIDFTATLSNISYEANGDTVLEVSFDLKVYNADTFVESNYSAQQG